MISSLSKFKSCLTLLVLGLCCFLFAKPHATLLCCVTERLMPFDAVAETLKSLCFSCAGGNEIGGSEVECAVDTIIACPV